MLTSVIFDLDGLLVDSEPAWMRARQELAAAYGQEWTDESQRAMAGVHTDVWVARVRECVRGLLTPEEVFEEIVSRMESYYLAREVPILPGAEDALATCADRYRVGLASGSPRRLIDAALKGAGWTEAFEQLISSDEVGRGKPDPEVYLELMRVMDLAPGSTAVVEDSGAGIRSGKASGAFVVAVPNPHTDPGPEVLALADVRIDSLSELAETLEQAGRGMSRS